MEFLGGGFAAVGQFSGVYPKVLFVNNKFSNGQFTQELQTIRRSKQDSDTKQTPTAQTGAVEKQIEKTEKQLETTETNAEGGKTEKMQVTQYYSWRILMSVTTRSPVQDASKVEGPVLPVFKKSTLIPEYMGPTEVELLKTNSEGNTTMPR